MRGSDTGASVEDASDLVAAIALAQAARVHAGVVESRAAAVAEANLQAVMRPRPAYGSPPASSVPGSSVPRITGTEQAPFDLFDFIRRLIAAVIVGAIPWFLGISVIYIFASIATAILGWPAPDQGGVGPPLLVVSYVGLAVTIVAVILRED